MLTDGLQLLGSSTADNLIIQPGATLPTSGNNSGELFYLTATDGSNAPGLYVYDGTEWQSAGGGTIFTGGTITNPIIIQSASAPQLTLGTSSSLGRVSSYAGQTLQVIGANASAGIGGGLSLLSGAGVSANAGDVLLQAGNSTSAGASAEVNVIGSYNAGAGAGGIVVIQGGMASTGAGGIISFRTATGNGSAAAERFRITATGALSFNGVSNYGTSGQVLTSSGNGIPSWQDSTECH